MTKVKFERSLLIRVMTDNINFTEEEIDVIQKYQSPGNDGISNKVNQPLYERREIYDPKVRRYIEVLTEACNKGSIPYDVDVYRGQMMDYYGFREANDEEMKGRKIKIYGFLSTSLSRPFNGVIQYRIKVPKGTHAISLSKLSKYKDCGEWEDELLIQRGYTLKVDHIERNEDNNPTVFGELINE